MSLSSLDNFENEGRADMGSPVPCGWRRSRLRVVATRAAGAAKLTPEGRVVLGNAEALAKLLADGRVCR
jgi:hypothetical protein